MKIQARCGYLLDCKEIVSPVTLLYSQCSDAAIASQPDPPTKLVAVDAPLRSFVTS